MFAARDQENLVSHNQGTLRGLQPKTPGARYPKTPLKIPLNDENTARGLGGKSVLEAKAKTDRSQWVTPAVNMTTHTIYSEPRTGRAVLGNKTTNAKAAISKTINGKTPAVREIEKSQVRPTTAARPKSHAPKSESSKLQILLDNSDPLSDEVDTNPPPPPEQPYVSDVFPAGVLTFDAIRPENRLKGYYDYYHNRRDENGRTRVDREMKAAQEKRFREADARIRKDLADATWDLALDSPRKIRKPLLARPTASATAKVPSYMQPTKARQPAVNPALTFYPRAIPSSSASAGVAASRNTLGYTKGRSVSAALHARDKSEAPARRPLARSNTTTSIASVASNASDATITPASHARSEQAAKPEFVVVMRGCLARTMIPLKCLVTVRMIFVCN
ncbi:hypothetical protein M406DRAFT_65435 [Cryphonectria parasitica EP155]|uniref:Uncharacterized protein n=1 Tax=Cryphonectria parasitica (strain ATCC 38755 / EP155) TaxID=660469 RepID=A0A9P4XSQ6_CRYP1|nr:uncharacterized protein M406DRAFT_65435 [Cryphonectria parasitica EP155]KAF3760274.1 hypothetical protein M406DRAFT_65435 [Cryphonectria parasitica EP155]